MKNFILKSIGLTAIAIFCIYFQSCRKSDFKEIPTENQPSYVLESKCGMLVFSDQQQFENVYEDLENRMETFEDNLSPDDSITSESQPLEDFERNNFHNSFRQMMEDQITYLEDNDISVTPQNYPDTLFAGNDELKTIMNQDRMYMIGDTIYYFYDDCTLFLLKAENCEQGKEALLNIHSGIPWADLFADYDYFKVKNICATADNPTSRSSPCQNTCGLTPRFTHSFVETDGGDSLEVTLTNISGIGLSNVFMNFTFIHNTTNFDLSITLLDPTAKFKIKNLGVEQCIQVRLDIAGTAPDNTACKGCVERIICLGGPCSINFEYFPGLDGGTFTAIPPALPTGVTVTKYTWNWVCEGLPESTTNASVIHKFPCFNENGFDVTLTVLLSNNCSSSNTQRVYPETFQDCCDSKSNTKDAYYVPGDEEKIWTRQVHNPFGKKRTVRAVSIYFKKKNNGKWRRRRTNQRITYTGNVRIGGGACCSCDVLRPVTGQKQARRKRRKFRYKYKVPNVPSGKKIQLYYTDEWGVQYEFGDNYAHQYNTKILTNNCP